MSPPACAIGDESFNHAFASETRSLLRITVPSTSSWRKHRHVGEMGSRTNFLPGCACHHFTKFRWRFRAASRLTTARWRRRSIHVAREKFCRRYPFRRGPSGPAPFAQMGSLMSWGDPNVCQRDYPSSPDLLPIGPFFHLLVRYHAMMGATTSLQ